MDKKPSTRQEIVVLLKKNGGLTVDNLAKALQITPMGVRQHLATLESDGLVRTSQLRRKVGRPSFVYRLTDRADDEFPKDYDNLLQFLLEELVKSDGTEKVLVLFQRYAERLRAEWETRVTGPDLPSRLEQVGQLLNEDGNLAEITPGEGCSYCLTIHNCRISKLTQDNPALCLHDRFIGDILGAHIVKTQCMATGDLACTYIASPKE